MRLLLDKIEQLNIGWNERRLDESDLYELCGRFNVVVDELPLTTAGFYYRVMGRDFIAVNSRLTGAERLAVMFHEFAHFLFHTADSAPAAEFHHVGRRTRKECEADVFAACAVLPRPLLENRTIEDLLEDGYPADLVNERFRILDLYGI